MNLMSQARALLSDQDLLRYLQCPHWPYWELFGDVQLKQKGMEEREHLMQGKLTKEKKIAQAVYGRVSSATGKTDEARAVSTLRLMKRGAATIYNGVLMYEDVVGHPTLLIRKGEPSVFGEWSYIPVLVKRRHVLRKEDHLHVGWHGQLLAAIQGVIPTEGYVLSPDGVALPSDPRDAEGEVKEILEELRRITGGECPEPTLRKACLDTSPWGACCLELAERTRDIALLFQVNRRQREALRQVGIATVDQAAAMDPSQLSGADPRLTTKSLQSIQRQARSLEEDAVIVRAPFKPSACSYEIHFDIESHPPTDTDYLFGCLVRDKAHETEEYVSFVAKRLADEKRLWTKFLVWIKTLPAEYVVYHYSMFEYERLGVLAKRYQTEQDESLKRFMDSMVDVNDLVKDHAAFPLYIYSLKNIGKLVGATWKGSVSHGADSVGVYERWLKQKQPADLESLIRYNEEDTWATATLLDWLTDYAKTEIIYHRPFPWEAKIS